MPSYLTLNTISVLTCNNPISCPDDTTHAGISLDAQISPAKGEEPMQLPKTLYEWILGVEAAREQNQLVDVNSCSSDLELYSVEKARAPPTEDWHSYTGYYERWFLLLPNERGILSSNDWVQIKNYLPLTRTLANGY
jgi:hypothetical protein